MAQAVWHEPAAVPPDGMSLHRDPLLSALLYGRGLRDAGAVARFLAPQPTPAPDPYQIPGMEEAVSRAGQAVVSKEIVAIFGDYDVDGITSTALLVHALRHTGVRGRRIIARLPTRDEGYGLSRKAIDEFVDGGVKLLIAVDCASTDHEHVDYALERGLDVVILDHHQMPDGSHGPSGAITVSARRLHNPEEPATQLAAVGVAYLLVSALAQNGFPLADGCPETDLQDLVALGTVADIAPLGGINRALVRDGLAVLQNRPRPGVEALCRVSEVRPENVDAETISFRLAPRLNAAGRMGDPALALDLLLATDVAKANRLAAELDALNTKRRIETDRLTEQAERLLHEDSSWAGQPVAVIVGPKWKTGLVGIAAARLAERYGRPVLLLAGGGKQIHGSARSVAGIDITAALSTTACRNLLTRFGGHGQAAGLSLAAADLPALRSALAAAIQATGVTVPVPPEVRLDAELPANRLTLETVRLLATLEPFGRGNEKPLLLLRDVEIARYTSIGRDRSHLKLFALVGRHEVPILAWGHANRSSEFVRDRRWDVAVTITEDHWNGQPRLQAVAKDFRPSTASVSTAGL